MPFIMSSVRHSSLSLSDTPSSPTLLVPTSQAWQIPLHPEPQIYLLSGPSHLVSWLDIPYSASDSQIYIVGQTLSVQLPT